MLLTGLCSFPGLAALERPLAVLFWFWPGDLSFEPAGFLRVPPGPTGLLSGAVRAVAVVLVSLRRKASRARSSRLFSASSAPLASLFGVGLLGLILDPFLAGDRRGTAGKVSPDRLHAVTDLVQIFAGILSLADQIV